MLVFTRGSIFKTAVGIIFYCVLPGDLAAQNKIDQNLPTTAPPQVRITQLRRFDQNIPLAPFAQNLTVRHYENYLERLWFALFITLLTVGSLVYFITFRIRQLLAIERLRARIAADLHDNIGAGLTEISICSGIAFHTQNLEILRKVRLPMEYRQQLYFIFKEALHNSLKHSAAPEVVLEAQMQGKRLLMRLKDDGKGFDPEKISRGNGLENMRRRAEIIGGTIEVYANPNKGAVVEFRGKIS
jgi:hypothetical protein